MAELRKYGLSLLDEPIGISEQGQRNLKTKEVQNEAQEIRRAQRLGRRAYRAGMRSGDFGQAMQALDWTAGKTGSTGAGIQIAGALERGLGKRQGWLNEQMDGIQSRRADPQPGLAVPGQPWDQNSNGVPNSIEAPQAMAPNSALNPQQQQIAGGMTTAPSGAPMQNGQTNYAQGNLGQRQSLFDRMTASLGMGGDSSQFREEATRLGVSPTGFSRATARANRLNTRAGSVFGPLLQALYDY